jgi:predicted nuclease of predicted toxin-antitoxin system
VKLLFDESLSPKLVELLAALFPESESALRNGLAGIGDLRILEYACANGFILVSTDRDFERLLAGLSCANIVILRSCNYPTGVAAEVLRRNAIRIAELPGSKDRLIIYSTGSDARLGCATGKPSTPPPSASTFLRTPALRSAVFLRLMAILQSYR